MRRSNRASARSDASAEPRRGRPGCARHMRFRPRWPLSRLISCATCEELRQAVLLELASDRQWQFSFADELHHARNLVGRELAAAKRQKVGFLDALSRLAHDERSDYLVALRVGNAGNACKLDGRMRHQHLFDLDWSNIYATSLDHFLDAPAKIQSPFSIEEAKIAGDEVAARIEGGAILVCILVITDGHVALDANFANFALRQCFAGLGIHDAQVDAWKRAPDAGKPNVQRLGRIGNGAVPIGFG